jgi:endonuclease/exonuclease/phosphatase family metal-dependent hydrolase
MFKLMTLNINQYGDKHGAWEARQARIVAAIATASPDVVALQAVRREAARAHGQDQAVQLASCLADYSHVHFQPVHHRDDNKVDGSAFLARLPLEEIRHYPLPFVDNPEDESQRILLCARVRTPAGSYWIANGHFSWVQALNDGNVHAALDRLTALDGPRLLVGDFNAQAESSGMERLAKDGWTDAWARLRPDDSGFTFEAQAPAQRIDYVWADASAAPRLRAIESFGAGAAPLSDHLGLVVTLA